MTLGKHMAKRIAAQADLPEIWDALSSLGPGLSGDCCADMLTGYSVSNASDGHLTDHAPDEHAQLFLRNGGGRQDLFQDDRVERIGQAKVRDDRQAQRPQASMDGDDYLGH